MTTANKKSKVTLEKLAQITQNEFTAVRSEMKHEFTAVRSEMKHEFAVAREDMQMLKYEIVDEVRKENLKVLQSNDTLVTKLDTLLMDQAAHTSLHKRNDDALYNHDGRIKKLEEVMHISSSESTKKERKI